MKKKLWKLIIMLFVFSMAGCQSTKKEEVSNAEITGTIEVPDPVQPTKEPEAAKIPEVTKEVKPTEAPEATKKAEPTEAPKATNTPVPVVEDITAVGVFLPEDSDFAWKEVWLDSETNTEIVWKGAPKQGKLSVKLCYPKSVKMAEREDSFELYLNGQGSNFSVRDAVETGVLGEEWAYYEFEKEYRAGSGELRILLKTHSKEGSKKIPFVIADIVAIENGTGADRRLDLINDNVSITFKQGNFITGEVKEYEYELYRFDDNELQKQEPTKVPTATPKPTGISDPTATPRPIQAVEGKGWYNLTYRLPETTTGWGDVWTESEANMVFFYLSDQKLSKGTVSVTLCVPKLEGVHRTDTFELAVHAFDDFMNWSGSTMKIIYENGDVIADNPERGVQKMKDCGGFYEVEMEVEYDRSKLRDGTELQIIFKSHSGAETGGYEITLSNLEIRDDGVGTRLVDFSGEEVVVKARMYISGSPVEYTLSKNVLEFYIKNSINKLPIGEEYQIEVYTSDGAEVVYDSSEPSVLTVDDDGKMTSHKKGTSTVTVINKSTGEQKSFAVTVSEPQIIEEEYEILMITGREGRLRFTTDFATKEGVYRYSSSDTSVATVEDDGTVKALKEGTTTVTVRDIVNDAMLSFVLEVYTPEDKDGIGQYIFMEKTGYVTADIAKRSYQLLYDVYKNVFDYFNYGEYEEVTLFFTVNDYSPAYSNSQDVYLASEHMLANAKDVDCITHELIHCAQNHISVGDYVWLMEGLTDYGRYLFGLHNEDCGWRLPTPEETGHYTDGYTGTAAFLKFVTENYCEDMPHIINKMFKGVGGYDDSIWEKNTGYTIDELWELYSKK